MRQRRQYLYVEIKKTIGMFPRMLLQAILLMALIGTIAFCGVINMEKEPLAVNVDIGIVVREDNTMTRMALGYVENLESATQVCHFVQMSEEEGIDLLEQRKIQALVVLPDQLVEGIMNGQNPSVEIYFPEDAGLEAMLLRELTESGAGLLRIAQAEIYGAYDTAVEYDLIDRLSVMEAEIDSYNLAFALDRLAIYRNETVSATGGMSVVQYYAASGVVLFFLMTGIAMYPAIQQEPGAFSRQLERQGTGIIWQMFCRWLCGFLCMAVFGGIGCAALRIVGARMSKHAGGLSVMLGNAGERLSPGIQIGILLMVMITATTLIYLLYSLAGSRTSGILLIFLFSVAAVYLSGGFVPSIFMPKTMWSVGEKLPTTYMIRACGGLLAGYHIGELGRCVAGMCGYTAVCSVAAYGVLKFERH